jgi:uncharacterized protein (DUF1684 family)
VAAGADRDRPRRDRARADAAEALIDIERLELADWRRRVSDLYATIRAEAAADPERAWRTWRATREALYRTLPQSPVPAATRSGFRARHWPYDPALRLEAVVQRGDGRGDRQADDMAATSRTRHDAADAVPGLSFDEPLFGGLTLALPVSTGGQEELTRIGFVDVPFPSGARRLGVYWMSGYAGGLFVPFRDATNGHETYGAGRYLLDSAKSADLGPGAAPNSLVLDFNFAFHPACAFDPQWSCPLAPPVNILDLRVEAGERLA